MFKLKFNYYLLSINLERKRVISKQNYGKLAKNIIENVGGKANIISPTHCITRLHFKQKNVSDSEEEVKVYLTS